MQRNFDSQKLQQLTSQNKIKKQNSMKRENPFSEKQINKTTSSGNHFGTNQQTQIISYVCKKVKCEQSQLSTQQQCQKKILENKHNQFQNTNKQLLLCKICMENYNLNRKMPIIVCSNKHVFCLLCIIKSIIYKNNKCPLCRVQVRPIQKDQTIFNQLQKNTKNKLNLGQVTKFKLKLNKKNSLHKLQDFQIIDKNTFAKTKQNDNWSCLVFQKLPHSLTFTKKNQKNIQKQKASLYSIKFTYHKILQNCLSFGLLIFDQFTQTIIHNVGFESHLFQYFTKKQSKLQGNQQNIEINLMVDIFEKTLKWIDKKNKIVAEESLQLKSIGEVSYMPFIALQKQGDAVTI